jgi:uncharacterized GH25 family protein
MMKPSVVGALVAGVLLLMASAALAHDLFLKLDTYFLEPHARARITVLNGTFAKSEGFVAPRSEDFNVVLGYPGEIVLLENPYAVGRDTPLRVRCLVDGRPVANQMVLWGKFVHMERATRRGLDYESKWATLTFEIR